MKYMVKVNKCSEGSLETLGVYSDFEQARKAGYSCGADRFKMYEGCYNFEDGSWEGSGHLCYDSDFDSEFAPRWW